MLPCVDFSCFGRNFAISSKKIALPLLTPCTHPGTPSIAATSMICNRLKKGGKVKSNK